jgi:MAGUK p55 subfamily protein 5
MDCLPTNDTHKHKLIDIKHIRALFNYEPDEDLYMPCKELGLSFLKGDVLHIISEEDMDWWQAYKDGDKDQTLAGLIPSQDFQEKRFSQMQALIGDSFMNRNNRNKPLCYRPINKSKRRRMFESINGTQFVFFDFSDL